MHVALILYNRNHLCTNFLVQFPRLAIRQLNQHFRSIRIRVGILSVMLIIEHQLVIPSQVVNMIDLITLRPNLQVSRITHATDIGYFRLVEGKHLPMIRHRIVVGQLVINHRAANRHTNIVGHIIEVAVCSGNIYFVLFAFSGSDFRWLFASVNRVTTQSRTISDIGIGKVYFQEKRIHALGAFKF